MSIANHCDTEHPEGWTRWSIPIVGPKNAGPFNRTAHLDNLLVFINPIEEYPEAPQGPKRWARVELIADLDTGGFHFEARVSGTLVPAICGDEGSGDDAPIVCGRLRWRGSRTDLTAPFVLEVPTESEYLLAREWADRHLVRLASGGIEVDYDSLNLP